MEKLFLASHENLINFGDDALTYFMLEKFPNLPKKLHFARNPFVNTETVEIYRDEAGVYFWSHLPFRTFPGIVFHPVIKECEDISFMPFSSYSKMVNVVRESNDVEFPATAFEIVKKCIPSDGNIYLANFVGMMLCKNGMPLFCNAAEGKDSHGEGIETALLEPYSGNLLYRQFIHYEDNSYFYLNKE